MEAFVDILLPDLHFSLLMVLVFSHWEGSWLGVWVWMSVNGWGCFQTQLFRDCWVGWEVMVSTGACPLAPQVAVGPLKEVSGTDMDQALLPVGFLDAG